MESSIGTLAFPPNGPIPLVDIGNLLIPIVSRLVRESMPIQLDTICPTRTTDFPL